MANKVYIAEETAKTWTDTGGDYTLDLGSLAADAVRVGAQGDLGAAPRADQYQFKLVIDGFDTAPVVGETVDLYLAFSDGTYVDGDVGTADAAGFTADLPNLMYAGSASVQTITAGDNLIISGLVQITQRYVSPVIHNNTADALLGTSDAHKFILTPVPPEVQ
jgi:hypothetical protein